MTRKQFILTEEEMQALWWEGTVERNADGSHEYTTAELEQFQRDHWEELAKAKGFKLDTVEHKRRTGGRVFTAEVV